MRRTRHGDRRHRFARFARLRPETLGVTLGLIVTAGPI
jgi:hypothetical protein